MLAGLVVHSRPSTPYAQPHRHHHHLYSISTMADALVWECIKVRKKRRPEGGRRGRMVERRGGRGMLAAADATTAAIRVWRCCR